MKKLKLILGTALALVVAQAGYGQTDTSRISSITNPNSRIKGTPHDFSMYLTGVGGFNQYDYGTNTGSGQGSGQVCQPCHTPHNITDPRTATEKPLWSHTMSSVASYTTYTNTPTLQSVPGQPSGKSKLCLSCHDGTVALDNFMGMDYIPAGTATMANTFGDHNLGTDLSDDHPISMTYNTALYTAELIPGGGGDSRLFDPSTKLSGITATGTIQTDMLDATDQVQCTSCHNPHDGTYGRYLKKSNTGSALCLTCHNK